MRELGAQGVVDGIHARIVTGAAAGVTCNARAVLESEGGRR
jgi:hypothetical protein